MNRIQMSDIIYEPFPNLLHLNQEDFKLDPFNKNGGLGKIWQLFGIDIENNIGDLIQELAASI